MNAIQLIWRVARAEGMLAARDRALDRSVDLVARARRSRLRLEDGVTLTATVEPPVLNVSPIPPYPRRGGSQLQMLDRHAVECRSRRVALLYPRGREWWLELHFQDRKVFGALAKDMTPTEATLRAARAVSASIVHIENLHGLPPRLPTELSKAGLDVVLSIHDFTLFCPRPHLIELPAGRFCRFCRDRDRCRRCLSADGPAPEASIEEHRLHGEEALARATCLVFPSKFLQRTHQELFPDRERQAREIVIPPATSILSFPPSTEGPTRGRFHVGFVGGAHVHKGGHLLAPLASLLRQSLPDVQLTVFGSGDDMISAELRRSGEVTMRGYYRAGTLPRLLRSARVSAAVLPSIWPETHGLVVDECLLAGVPVVSFDLGAVGARFARTPCVRLVRADAGIEGLAQGIYDLRERRDDLSRHCARLVEHDVQSVAERHLKLYAILEPADCHSLQP